MGKKLKKPSAKPIREILLIMRVSGFEVYHSGFQNSSARNFLISNE
jgi:hypothetical protein